MITTTPENIKKYHAQGAWGDRRFDELFYQTATQKPDEIALVDPSNKPSLTGQEPRRLTYGELADEIDRLAVVMLTQGIGKDDILLVQMPNVVELVMIYLAASRIGAIVSPVPMQYMEHELSGVLPILQPKTIIAQRQFKNVDFSSHIIAALDRVGGQLHHPPTQLYWDDGSMQETSLQQLMVQSDTSKVLEAHRAGTPLSADEVFTVCWTSGTEGTPKGIPRSHNHWMTVGRITFEGNQIQAGESLLNPFPFVNMASIGGLFLSWLYSGGKLVLHHPMDLPVFLQQITQEATSYTIAPPALLNTLLKNEALLASCDFSGVRAIGSGSAPLDEWMVAGFKEKFNIEVVNHFGSNEGVSLLCGPNDTMEPGKRARLFPRRNATMASRLVSGDSGREITEPGIPAELQIKGPGVFDGYFKAPALTAAAFSEDGFFLTGDLFEIDREDTRFYRFIGRCKDLIIRGGMNIAPAELDNLLSAHNDVAEAAVAGYPCDLMGERVAAFIVSKSGNPITLEDITRYLKECKVASFKLPERVVMVEALPRNPLGKVVRHRLADML